MEIQINQHADVARRYAMTGARCTAEPASLGRFCPEIAIGMDSHAERFLYKVFCHLRTSNARIFVETVAAIVDKATKRSGLTPLESGLVYDLTAIDSRNDFF
jgi:hypothetical protein